MKTNDFEDFMTTGSGRSAATLLATHKVKPGQIYATVQAGVMHAIAHLMDGTKYTTEMLTDPAVWSTWLTAERRVAGMCLAYLERRKVVALRLHRTPSGKGKNRYCTLTTPDTGYIKRVMFVDASAKARAIKLGERSTPCL